MSVAELLRQQASRMLLQMHDEPVLEVVEEEHETVANLVRCMVAPAV